jgi:GNAT superfamily N-acetyltransferase
MKLVHAEESDFAEIIDLANLAYRATGAGPSWNSEEGLIEGQRLNESLLREDLAAKPKAHLLLWREGLYGSNGSLLGTVWLDPKDGGVWYLGLLMVRSAVQNRQLGRALLAAAEEFAKTRGGNRIHMTVLNVREPLIAWYLRRGYELTGNTLPFPYRDERFGRPLRADLHFVVLEKDL